MSRVRQQAGVGLQGQGGGASAGGQDSHREAHGSRKKSHTSESPFSIADPHAGYQLLVVILLPLVVL